MAARASIQLVLVAVAGVLLCGAAWNVLTGSLAARARSLVAVYVALPFVLGALPRRAGPAPGIPLDSHRGAMLHALVRDVADAMDARPPSEIRVTMGPEATVLIAGGALGLGGRRVLVLGLPLLDAITVADLRVLVAWALAYDRNGDARVHRVLGGTSGAVERTFSGFRGRGSLATMPFAAPALLLMRGVFRQLRRSARNADAAAAAVAGGGAVARALLTTAYVEWELALYRFEFAEVAEAGGRPPFLEGLRRFASADHVPCSIASAVGQEIAGAQDEPFSGVPALGDRLATLGHAGWDLHAAADRQSALSLLDRVDELEAAAVAADFGCPAVALPRVTWDEVPGQLRERWREIVELSRGALRGMTVAMLPSRVQGAESDEEPYSFDGLPVPVEGANRVLAAALGLALLARGWHLGAPPIRLLRDGISLEPFTVVDALASGSLDDGAWWSTCAELGIADVPLG